MKVPLKGEDGNWAVWEEVSDEHRKVITSALAQQLVHRRRNPYEVSFQVGAIVGVLHAVKEIFCPNFEKLMTKIVVVWRVSAGQVSLSKTWAQLNCAVRIYCGLFGAFFRFMLRQTGAIYQK
ncbi:MAG: hypothetical protein HGA84_06345 [Syntrophobacteraceae bacterium]|nr:hypothetical protein [Syntrophobacteraceae bacterium]